MRLPPRTRLGPYEIVSPLGAGGMGEVYRARDTRLDRDVALKVLSEGLASDARALARFEREAKAIAALTHPNILSVFDVSLEGATPFAVTELLEGGTLAERIAAGPLPWKEAVAIGIAVAEGLAAAHSKGIVHRDVKPSNIFLTEDGRVKILDFGLARASRAEAPELAAEAETISRTEPGTVLGTVGYMSPEQVRGLAAEQTSDIFSLGCVLFEMVGGRRPFTGSSVPEAMASILRDPAPSLLELGVAVPAELDRVVGHCLEKSPDRRFQTAQDLVFALRSLQTSPTLREAVPPPRRVRRPAALVSLAALLAVVAVGAWLGARRIAGRGSGLRSIAVLPLANLSGDSEQEYFADGMTDELINDLSRIESLRVISRTSSMRFKGSREALPAIAKALDVDAVVEGSVRRAGGQVRIAARLVRASDEKGLWSESYERDFKDVFALQSEIASAIVKGIGAQLTREETARLAPHAPVAPEAYEAYLKGVFYMRRLDPESLERGRRYLETAVELAPDFAPPYVEIAFYNVTAAVEGSVAPKLAFPKAEAAAMKALELDSNLPGAHNALAWIYMYFHWNLDAADREVATARKLGDPNAGVGDLAARYRGDYARAVERERAKAATDPLSLGPYLKLGTTYTWMKRYDEAIATFRRALEMHADSSQLHELLSDALASARLYTEAVAEQRKALELAHLDDWAEELAKDFASAGWEAAQRNLARKRLDELVAVEKEGTYVSPYAFAALETNLGEKDEAFRWLDKAVEERSPGLVAFRVDPQWEPLRGDPRFDGIARRIVPSP